MFFSKKLAVKEGQCKFLRLYLQKALLKDLIIKNPTRKPKNLQRKRKNRVVVKLCSRTSKI